MAFSNAAMPSQRAAPGVDSAHIAADDRFVRALIRRFIADPHLADDLAQDTWLAALRHSAASRLFERAWLGTVARNFVFQAMRGRARRVARETAAAQELAVDTVQEAFEDTDLRHRVLAAVEALDEPYRAVIRARFFDDLPPTAIADQLGVPIETVRTRIKRGLVQVRARMRTKEPRRQPPPLRSSV